MQEYVYDPKAGFHMVHSIYIELTKWGYSLNELYEYSFKELLFILKYRREGEAYRMWREGTMTRAAFGKNFPTKVEKAIPELFEHESLPVSKLPPEMKAHYQEQLQKQINKKYQPHT